MQRFWDEFLLPVARGCEAKVICEIGSQFGGLTRRLLDYCIAEGAVAHVIDPAPAFDVEVWREEYGDTLVFHRHLSLEVLGTIPLPDMVLIDGDHNWYTVINELSLLERKAEEEAGALPVIALHDIGWPYGRRDMYYEPKTIPAEHRQKYEQRAIRPDSESLVDEGINEELCNAVHEGGEHNGVWTAVEDFLAKSAARWTVETVPGFHGLALLVPAARLEHEPSLQRAAARWRDPAALRAHIEALEADRIVGALGRLQAVRQADHLQAAAKAARQQQAAAEERLRQLKRSQLRLREELRVIAESRAWRVGQFLASSFRALTRRPRREEPDALQVMIDRLGSFEEKQEAVIARRQGQARVGGAREEG